MNYDALLLANLQSLAYPDSTSSDEDDSIILNIPFGNIAFIKESFWKLGENYIESKEKRGSHPGLSIYETNGLVAFGSSQLDNRDRNDKNNFFVDKNQCGILSKNMVFLLNTCIPATIDMIDSRKDFYYEKLCPSKFTELRNVIKHK